MNKIKYLLIVGVLLIFKSNAQYQEGSQLEVAHNAVKPLETFRGAQKNDLDYFKDVNNLLDPYLGTWEGDYNGKTLKLEITKFKDNYLAISVDALHIKYEITEGNEVLSTTFNLPNSSEKQIKGSFFNSDMSFYIAYYIGFLEDCNQKGRVIIELLENGSMSFWVYPAHDLVLVDCPQESIHIMPIDKNNPAILTKQE